VDAGGATDERTACGRRSRVVLTPRRWRQVGERQAFADDGGKQARSPRRARRKPLKPLRGECRENRCDRGDFARVLFSFRTRGYGRNRRPAFPAPFDLRGSRIKVKLARMRGEIAKSCVRCCCLKFVSANANNVVPANAGTHNHWMWLLHYAGAPASIIRTSGGYGSRLKAGMTACL
jgi:hypothetical protein